MSNKCKRVGRRRTIRQMPITRFIRRRNALKQKVTTELAAASRRCPAWFICDDISLLVFSLPMKLFLVLILFVEHFYFFLPCIGTTVTFAD